MSEEGSTRSQVESSSFRLPHTATPEYYNIYMNPNLVESSFTGSETVTVTVHKETDELVLNAVDLVIDPEWIYAVSEQYGRLQGSCVYDTENERICLVFPEQLLPGTWQVGLAFSGVLNDKLHGFYRSTYKDASGQEKVLATTQFEATDARRAFPCWDEPDLKAVFELMLAIPQHLTAISNTPIVRETVLLGMDKKEVQFAPTIKMSTYLYTPHHEMRLFA